MSTDLSNSISNFLNTKGSKDSIMVLSEDGSLNSYSVDGKIFRVFSDVEELRNQMLSILCQNEKANFTILFNPSVTESVIRQTEEAKPVPEKSVSGNNLQKPVKPTSNMSGKSFRNQGEKIKSSRPTNLEPIPLLKENKDNTPDYLKKTVPQFKDEGFIKKHEVKPLKQDNQ
jgi:hypothetical protein